MADKDIVQDQQQRTTDDIQHDLEFIAAIRQGLFELDNGDSVPIEEVEKQLPSWVK